MYFIIDGEINGHPPVSVVRSVSAGSETKHAVHSPKVLRHQSVKVL